MAGESHLLQTGLRKTIFKLNLNIYMARHKNTERGIRKLTRLGDSYAITLPIDLIRELSWREKQKVEVVRRGKTLVVRDWE